MADFDVAIIGGGLVGCAAAYYLSKFGVKVILVEQGDLNREASGRNAGSLHFQLEYRLVRYGDALADQFAQVIPLTLVAMNDWAGLEAELASNLEVEMHGGLIVAESASDIAMLEQRQALHSKWGLDSRLLSTPEVHRIAPYLADSVIGAGYCPSEGHANPRLVTLAFAGRAGEHGAQLLGGTRVCAIERSGPEWQLTLQPKHGGVHEIRAGKLLNAAGAWSGDVAAMVHLHLPIFPVPLLMSVLERSSPLVPHLVQHTSKRLTVKQVAHGNILIGGGWPGRFPLNNRSMDVHQRPAVVMSNILSNINLAVRLVPGIRQLHLTRTWAGTTGVTADQMPLLGEIPEVPGFYVAAGGAAFTHGPTYARLISELITDGRASHPIDLYSPSRFSHVNNFMSAGLA